MRYFELFEKLLKFNGGGDLGPPGPPLVTPMIVKDHVLCFGLECGRRFSFEDLDLLNIFETNDNSNIPSDCEEVCIILSF